MSYVSIPNGTAGIHNFSDPYYYGKSNSSISNLVDVSGNLWKKFLDIFFSSSTNAGKTYYTRSDGSTISLADLLHTSGSWPPAELTQYKDYLLIESLFSGALKSFFYDYMPNQPGVIFSETSGDTSYVTHFQNFLTDPNRPDIAKKQNSILLWVWEALSLMLESVNKATPTKGNYLLAMTGVEDKTATAISNIQYLTQQNAEDYSSQSTNMNRQKEAEVYRAQRSSAGKKGQAAQAMITSLRDQSTQHSQLMTTLMQTMESMIQSIIKK
jgi:hypothetical protein